MHGQPGVAHRRAGPGAHRIPHGGDQRHHKDQRENEHAEAFQLVAPVHEQEDQRNEEGAHRKRLVEVGDGAAILRALFDDGDEVKHGADGERAQCDAEQMFAPA